jgi:hypothetical protein
MLQKNKCKCGSPDVVFVIQKGRSKKLQVFCEKCLPVEPVQEPGKSLEDLPMNGKVKPVLQV